ncbi:MAG: phage portal protein [Parcubacteria group bacterium]
MKLKLRWPWGKKAGVIDDWPWSSPPPESWLLSGGLLTLDQALGLPALLGVLLRIAQGVGMTPQLVYSDGEVRDKAKDSWQWTLLHKRPSDECGPATFRSDIALSLAGSGKAYVRKFKVRDRVRALMVLDPAKVTTERKAGRLVFRDECESAASPAMRTQSEIIFMRGPSLSGGPEGIAPITSARMAISAGVKRIGFETRHFDNGARPGVVLEFPNEITKEQAKEQVEVWNETHKGWENASKTGVVGGGAKVKDLPVSLEDAQFVETNQFTARQIAMIYGVPPAFLCLGEQGMTDQDWTQLLTFGLGWIYTTIDQAFNADPDLFPDDAGLFCEHLADGLIRFDPSTRYRGYKNARQGGWITGNEIRQMENRPPHKDGDELQKTPVGGAPNEPSKEEEE